MSTTPPLTPLTFSPTSYLLAGQPTYLLSGEFHYFRVPKADWRRRMQLFKAAGGNVLATYIPWLLHEPVEGQFRFSGADWLDLEGFLQAALAKGLYVIARPGPYQYSELVYDGLPGWLVHNYPQILAQNAEGKPFRESSVSYLHPLFLAKVRAWFDEACPIIARYTVKNGGPVAFVQLDNEMAGIHEWFGTLDYHPDSMGFGQAEGRYPRFLRRRYADIRALNKAYYSGYRTFEEVFPVKPGSDPVQAFRRRKDYYDFYVGTLAEYSQILAQMIGDYGIQVPLVHNSGNPGMNAHFLETAETLGSQYLLGSDHYYNLDQTWPQNNPTPQYAAKVFVSLEQLRLMGFPPTVFEIPGGSAAQWPPVTPGDALACYLVNLAFGMRGSNYYIFTGGPNPPGAGANTDSYDYGAGIGADGEIRPLYHAQVAFADEIKRRPWLADAHRPYDHRLALDFEQARSGYFWTQPVPGLYSSSQAWDMLRRGPVTTALCAGLSPTFVDLAKADWCGETSTPLVVTCSSSMAAAKQQRLVDFLHAGGKVLFTPVLPVVDENLNPCAILLEALGVERFTIEPGGQTRPVIAGVTNVTGQAHFCEVPAGAQVIGKDEFSGRTLAWLKDFTGGGQAIFLGLDWSYSMYSQGNMFANLLSLLGLSPVIHSSNPNVWITLWEKGGQACMFLINLFTSPAEVELTLNYQGKQVKIAHTVEAMTVKVVDL
jgi:beta-galactosidase